MDLKEEEGGQLTWADEAARQRCDPKGPGCIRADLAMAHPFPAPRRLGGVGYARSGEEELAAELIHGGSCGV